MAKFRLTDDVRGRPGPVEDTIGGVRLKRDEDTEVTDTATIEAFRADVRIKEVGNIKTAAEVGRPQPANPVPANQAGVEERARRDANHAATQTSEQERQRREQQAREPAEAQRARDADNRQPKP